MSQPHVQSFTSIEEVFEALQAGERHANANLAPEQAALTYGQHWVRFYDIPDKILIFSKVDTVEEFAEAERQAAIRAEEPMTVGELAYAINALRERHERGYLYGTCYSKITPEGELGDTHRGHVWPISPGLFNLARAARWDVDAMTSDGKYAISDAFMAWGTHERLVRTVLRANGGDR